MGAWGTGSHDCDSVMDNVDCLQGKPAQNEKATNKILKKVKSSVYDRTEFHGTVLFMVERGDQVSRANLEKALAEAEKAVKNAKYLAEWHKPSERSVSLLSEIKQIKKAIAALPPVTPKKLKEGQEVKFRFEVGLDELAGSGGIEGINNMLDEAWHQEKGYGFTVTDIGYKIVGHKDQSVTLEANGVLESIS